MIGWLAILGSALAGQPEADDCLQVKVSEAYDAGWRFRTWQSATLDEGEIYGTRALLFAGRSYRILACADGAAKDLDLIVYQADGTVSMQDSTKNREPLVDFTPPSTGVYVVAMFHRAAAAPNAPAAAALAIGAR